MSDTLWTNAGKAATAIGTATIDSGTDLFTVSSHGLNDGDRIVVDTLTGGAVGVLAENGIYWVRDSTTNTFAVALTKDGLPIDFSTNGGADVYAYLPGYDAAELRRAIGALLYKDSTLGARFASRQGVIPAMPGGIDPVTLVGSDWTVPDLNMVVCPNISSDDGPYIVQHAEESGTLNAADGSNDRIDCLDMQIQDDHEDASGFRRARIVYVPGTPGSGVRGTLTTNSFELVRFLVSAGGTPAPSIISQAQMTAAAGGVLVVRDSSELPSSAHEGSTALQIDTQALLTRLSGAWETLGNAQGYQYGGRVVYESSGTFVKGDFPGLRAIDVTVIGGGGGSGGVQACGVGEAAESGGGQGGTGAKKFLTADLLGSSETVTVGAGGAAGQGAGGAGPGGNGGASSFTVNGGTDISCPGGGGGTQGAASSTNAAASGGTSNTLPTGGDINVLGQAGGTGLVRESTGDGESIRANFGGSSAFGMGGGELGAASTTTGGTGNQYGGGASGARNNNGDAVRGGSAGADGVVIVELYY